MHADHWNHVAKLVEQALDERPEDRSSWLRLHVGDDPDLMALAAKMLEEHERVERSHFLGGGDSARDGAQSRASRALSPESSLRFRSSDE